MLFINRLHLFTVMWLTGNVKFLEKDGKKEPTVIAEPDKGEKKTCLSRREGQGEGQYRGISEDGAEVLAVDVGVPRPKVLSRARSHAGALCYRGGLLTAGVDSRGCVL